LSCTHARMHSQFLVAGATDDWVPHTVTYSTVSQTVVCVQLLICQPVALIKNKNKYNLKKSHIYLLIRSIAGKIPYILESNLHPFYSFRGLKNQMQIRIVRGLDSQLRAGFWCELEPRTNFFFV
jgi:hypothetical protein